MKPIKMSALRDADLRLLRIFAAVVDAGGLSAAQYTLNRSLPAISTALSSLETRLGLRLCERGRSGFEVTKGGRLAYAKIQSISEALDGFQRSIETFKKEELDQISMGLDDAIVTNAEFPLGDALNRFSAKLPHLSLEVSIMNAPEMEQALLDNRITVAIGAFRDVSSALEYVTVYNERQLLCCGRSHPAFGLKDGRKLEEIVANSAHATRSFDDDAAPIGKLAPTGSEKTTKVEAILTMVLSGLYLGYLPEHVCRSRIEAGELWALDPATYSYDTKIKCVFKPSSQDPRVAMFLDALNLENDR